MLEMLTYHTGLGVVIAALAAYALPRFPLVDEAVAAGAAGRRGRWYNEQGALDASAREPAAAEAGTRRHPVADDAAIGAGAAGAGALAAEHHHRERVANREAGREPVTDSGAGRREPVADREAEREPVTATESAAGRDG